MRTLLLAAAVVAAPQLLPAQQRPDSAALAARAAATAADHRRMLDLLGIESLRPGPSGNPQAPNAANRDETRVPFYVVNDPLVDNRGRRVGTPGEWWAYRRAEIVEAFDREIYGRVPAVVPGVTWEVVSTARETNGGIPVVVKRLAGRVDNSAYPQIEVAIDLTLATPAEATGPVPVIMEFGFNPPAGAPRPQPPANAGPSWQQQLLAAGWGYAVLSPASIQADNGAGLTQGIIGLANRGGPRKVDDWGALRAWAWGASRALDYFETDDAVDATRVGIEGLSRYGKAALVAMAYEPRFAVGFIGSSGAGGAKLLKRVFGEQVENLAASGEYHWFAGNFIRYAGPLTEQELPVDAHHLIAMAAPRPVFISVGSPTVEGEWVDARGMFLAGVHAGPVYRLLGARDLGTSTFPQMESGRLQGELAFRQHAGGHTTGPNWPSFIEWAKRHLGADASELTAAGGPPPLRPLDRAVPRTDANSKLAHEQLLAKRTQGKIDLYFIGNSITRRWGATDYPELLAHWRQSFIGWNAANFAWGADGVEHMIWRLEHGELDGVNPKVIVISAGTNNVGGQPGGPEKVLNVTRGVRALVDVARRKAPEATILLMGIFPRNGNDGNTAVVREIDAINRNLALMADGKTIRFMNINNRLADRGGKLVEGVTTDGLHLSLAGYQLWADALKPVLTELLGLPAAVDQAPPATGDPSARR